MAARALSLGTALASLRRHAGAAAALTLLVLAAAPAPGRAQAGGEAGAGAKGAQTYCFMRSSGNSHEVSWMAAYALIKRQSGSMFKTSPEHAAVMITEAVVQNPTTYPDCGRFLGDLYTRRVRLVPAAAPGGDPTAAPDQPSGGSPGQTGGMTRSERYGN